MESNGIMNCFIACLFHNRAIFDLPCPMHRWWLVPAHPRRWRARAGRTPMARECRSLALAGRAMRVPSSPVATSYSCLIVLYFVVVASWLALARPVARPPSRIPRGASLLLPCAGSRGKTRRAGGSSSKGTHRAMSLWRFGWWLQAGLTVVAWLPHRHSDCMDKKENVRFLRILATDYDQGLCCIFPLI